MNKKYHTQVYPNQSLKVERYFFTHHKRSNLYKAGIVTLTDVLDAQTLLQQNRDKYVESYANYQKKRIEYLQVTGR